MKVSAHLVWSFLRKQESSSFKRLPGLFPNADPGFAGGRLVLKNPHMAFLRM